jgi:alkylated DNA nucleotide flippase Atl1
VTESQQRILDTVRRIPAGFVRTYGDICPGAPRAAGRVLSELDGAEIPWWRVVRADGSLAAGEEQPRRLEAEGVPFLRGARPRVAMRVARMHPGSAHDADHVTDRTRAVAGRG